MILGEILRGSCMEIPFLVNTERREGKTARWEGGEQWAEERNTGNDWIYYYGGRFVDVARWAQVTNSLALRGSGFWLGTRAFLRGLFNDLRRRRVAGGGDKQSRVE